MILGGKNGLVPRYAYFQPQDFSVNGHKGAGALVLWLWEETHVPKVVGSNPGTVYWMDIYSHYLL